MERRDFIGKGMALPFINNPHPKYPNPEIEEEVFIERAQVGQPHQGKVLAAIQPHCDDMALFAGGTVTKLIKEVYK